MEQALNESWQNKWVRGYLVSLVRCKSAQGQGSRPTLLWFPSLVHCFSRKTTQRFIEWNIRTRGASEIRSKEEKRVTTWTSFATAGKKVKYNSEQAVCQPEENQRQVTGNVYSSVTSEHVKIFPFLLLKYKNLIHSFLMNNYCFFLSYKIYSFKPIFLLLQNKIKGGTDLFSLFLVQYNLLFKNPCYKIDLTMQNITQFTNYQLVEKLWSWENAIAKRATANWSSTGNENKAFLKLEIEGYKFLNLWKCALDTAFWDKASMWSPPQCSSPARQRTPPPLHLTP